MSVDHTLFVHSQQQAYGAKAYLVKLHPLVLFNIVDHYSRRSEDLPRVVGTLLGQYNDGVINITNSYAVLHQEKPSLAFGTPSNQSLYKMHRLVNPAEVMLGWYATTIASGDLTEDDEDDEREINMHSVALHQRYNEEMLKESTYRQTVHLVVDTSLESDKLGVKAYVASPVPLGEFGERCYVFKQIEVEVESSPPEKFAIHTIAKSTASNKDGDNFEGLGTIATDVDFLQNALVQLLGMLDSTLGYVNKVVDGQIEGDNNIGYLISTALSSIPRIDADAYQKTFSNSEKDIRMIQHLISLVEEQLKIASPLVVL